VGVTASPRGQEALRDEGYRFVVPVEPEGSDYDGQGHLNNAAIVRLFNDIRVAYVSQRLGERWRDHLREERLVVVAREVHVLYESEGLPSEHYVGAMRYLHREGRAAIIEQRLVEAATARSVARCWVVQLLARDGRAADWPDFYFPLVAKVEGRAIEQRPSVRRAWGPVAAAVGEP
jgi:acyl-CoA thioesterase FadM